MKSRISKHFEENYDRLVKIVRNRAGGEYNAEDVVAEAFARAIQYQDSYREVFPFENWFTTILNNALKDFKRDERHSGTFVELEEDHISTDEDGNFIMVLADELVEEIESRKGDEGTVLYLYFLRGYKRRDIVRTTEFNDNTIKSYIKRFKAEMKEKYPEEDGGWGFGG